MKVDLIGFKQFYLYIPYISNTDYSKPENIIDNADFQ